jgi:hypothetical protein
MNPARRGEFLLKSKRQISILISINSKKRITIMKTLMKIILMMVLAMSPALAAYNAERTSVS